MTDEELLRYSRQIMLPEVDVEGQDKICAGHVAIVGLGGLGSPAALYLASAGVGTLTLIDDDQVEISNLQRQIIHTERSLNSAKVESAQRAIAHLNRAIHVHSVARRLDENEFAALASTVDVVLDATDNFATRYAINRACVATKTPLVSGAAIRMEGQVSVFDPRLEHSPCYQCLYRDGLDEALNCAENGVLAPVVGIIGTMQAMETLKLLGEFGEPLVGRVIYFDAKRTEVRSLKLNRDPACATCSSNKV
ncbi:MAG: molybdopterin-synthase adenylyltransferase MoeB [Gammaproteobacteria bacterium]|nr:molybdopterin-synthase adenylyltransferase MoeB [Gammaproteobacteria bacterium]